VIGGMMRKVRAEEHADEPTALPLPERPLTNLYHAAPGLTAITLHIG
jgi:hypothetical protein